MTPQLDAVIVGGGLAGLTCAGRLRDAGLSFRLLEAADAVGGRVRTDEVDGFRLDRGFQVLLTAYPEARAWLDHDELDLRRFEPGALVRFEGGFHRLSDPWRRPRHALATATSRAATPADLLRIWRFRTHTTRGDLGDIFARPELPTIELLRRRGFSDVIVERFLRPFLGGVFLDPELRTSSRMAEFVFRMFSSGDAALPARGMEEIPRQLARRLPADAVRTGARVASIERGRVVLTSGEEISGRVVIVATDAPAARRLLGDPRPAPGRAVTCLYFVAPTPPVAEPILILNGDGRGPINNLCVPSQISPEYAPGDAALVSATVLGHHADPASLTSAVRSQLTDWFGPGVGTWRHLETYSIPYALPDQSPPALEPDRFGDRLQGGIFICGDHRHTGSIDGAMASGRRAGDAVVAALRST